MNVSGACLREGRCFVTVPNVPGVSLGWSQKFVSHERWAGQSFAVSHVSAERS